MFDAQAFLESAVQGEMSTERPLIPENEYHVEIEDVEVKETKNPSWLQCTLKTQVDDEAAAATLGRKSTPFTYNFSFPIELDEGGGMAMGEGKNILVGQLRAATGQNNAAKPWRFADLIGNTVLIQVAHEKQKDSDRVNERIRRVVAV